MILKLALDANYCTVVHSLIPVKLVLWWFEQFLLVAAAELEASSGQGPGGFGAMDGAAG